MADYIYDIASDYASDNFVTVCQTADGKLLTKRNYLNHQVSYDKAYKYNLFECRSVRLTNYICFASGCWRNHDVVSSVQELKI